MRDWFPPRPFLDAIALRGVTLWCFARAVIAAGSMAAADAASVSASASVLVGTTVTAVVVVVSWLEMWRRGEMLFLANLGLAFRHTAAFLVLQCVLLEVAWALARG